MSELYARYPFLKGAKDEIENIDTSLQEVFYNVDDKEGVSETAIQIRERALERVLNAVNNYDVGSPHDNPNVELLSYPVARVLVSAVSESSLISRYATSEAKTASQRIRKDMQAAQDMPDWKQPDRLLSRDELISEFGLETVEKTELSRTTPSGSDILVNRYTIGLDDYLPLASNAWGDEWDLIHRSPSNGSLTITPDEMDKLLQAAIKKRVKDGEDGNSSLPVHVDDPIIEVIKGQDADDNPLEMEQIMEALRGKDLVTEIDTVVPDLFPPCMKQLLHMLQDGQPMPHHSRVALGTFFINIGMSTDESVELMEIHPDFDDGARYHMEHLRGETGPVEYDVPACATMKSYGDCYNPDELCDTINHPMGYYEKKLEKADVDNYTDWREQNQEEEDMSVDETGEVPVFTPGSGGSDSEGAKSGGKNTSSDTESRKETTPDVDGVVTEERDDSNESVNSIVDDNDDDDVEVFDPSA